MAKDSQHRFKLKRKTQHNRVLQFCNGGCEKSGLGGREGWSGWDTVKAHMPESEIGSLIIELRSATAGVGTFTYSHDHMAELTGRAADQVVASRKAEAV